MRWSEASRAQRAIKLGQLGITTRYVLLDLRDAARDEPALRDELARCKSDEARERLAFEWFEWFAQPADRTNWVHTPVWIASLDSPAETWRTPDWPGGRLPPLEDDLRESLIEPELRRREAAWPKQAPALFPWATIQRAVSYYADGYGRNDVADKLKLPAHDATRVRRMWRHDLLRLNQQGKLAVDPRVRQVRNTIALRYWDEQSGAWLDPYTSLS